MPSEITIFGKNPNEIGKLVLGGLYLGGFFVASKIKKDW